MTSKPQASRSQRWSRWQDVRAQSVSSRIVDQVRAALFRGELKPGDVLGSETDLAQKFGVSRVPVRDAFKTLQALGIVEVKMGANGGARIAAGDPKPLRRRARRSTQAGRYQRRGNVRCPDCDRGDGDRACGQARARRRSRASCGRSWRELQAMSQKSLTAASAAAFHRGGDAAFTKRWWTPLITGRCRRSSRRCASCSSRSTDGAPATRSPSG